MKHFLLAIYLATIGVVGIAIAQNINRSVQLSQSGLGPIGFDTNNGIYLPAKLNTAGQAPTLSAFGTGATISGSDVAGQIGLGTSPGSAGVVTFRQAYTGTPYCMVIADAPTLAAVTSVGYRATPNGILINHILTAGTNINYTCIGRSTG